MKVSAPPTPRDSFPDMAWPIGPTARKSASCTSRPVTGSSRSNAKTGVPVPTFGVGGVVDLKKDDDQDIDLVTGEVGLHSTPVVARNVVIVGAAHLTGGVPKKQKKREGLRPRIRRANRQASLDFPHHPSPGRIWKRHLAEGVLGLHGKHRRLGTNFGG